MSALIRIAAFLAAAALSPAALAAEASMDKADVVWMLVSTTLVLFMTIPGIALFYGGMARKKNVLSILAQTTVICCALTLVWFAAGYSLAFGPGSAFVGGLSHVFLNGLDINSMSGSIPTLLFVCFQMTFAILTATLMIGAFAGRMKFSAMLIFMILWSLCVYSPVCHWVWAEGGFFFDMGALDYAGGTVVHINAGVSGLELKYDDLLTGENGVVLTAVNAWGYTLEQSYETERFPTEGDGLRLTIDANIQHYLENALGYAVKEHHVAARAVGIVMDVNTGAVLAMSTTPAYDPNQPRVLADKAAREAVEGLSGDERAAALQLAQQTQWRNKAVSDLYEPGSVFKLITCAAALDAGAITKHSSFYCGESISVAGTRFHCANHKRHGAQSVTQALENSCNQSFIQIGGRLGREAFCDYFAAFGLREPTGIDLPAEPKKSLYYTADRMGPVELASCAFGQSSKISYLEMAAAVCAVVNGGKLMQPYVVSEILAPDGSTIEQFSPVCKRQVLKAETSQTMREMMEAVVLHGGGRNAQIPGYRVGGKSGTSQKLDSADEKARIASFVAVAPIDDPQFLCLVCLDEPHSWTTAGGSLSAPVCAEVLEQTLVYKGVPRTTEAPAASTAETAADLPADGDSFDGA